MSLLEEKYYLGDAGYMLRSRLLVPYKGVRDHLKKYSKNPPRTPKELSTFVMHRYIMRLKKHLES
jgi:hypothetical protein